MGSTVNSCASPVCEKPHYGGLQISLAYWAHTLPEKNALYLQERRVNVFVTASLVAPAVAARELRGVSGPQSTPLDLGHGETAAWLTPFG